MLKILKSRFLSGKKLILLALMQALIILNVRGQSLHGLVLEKSDNAKTPLIGASVFWLGTTIGAATDENGEFEIDRPQSLPANLVVSFVGFTSDTILVKNVKKNIEIFLEQSVQLGEVTVTERAEGNNFKLLDPVIAESISSNELTKAACCNLSESFETNATVDVVFSDAVSGAKKIQMLGLDGVYTQIQAENVPLIRGLSSNYGMGFVPGTWIESIQIIKGPGSVSTALKHGPDKINGVISNPMRRKTVRQRVYGNTGGRLEANVQSGYVFNEKSWNEYQRARKHHSARKRHEQGRFLDIPRSQQYNVFNRWKFTGKKLMGQMYFMDCTIIRSVDNGWFRPNEGIAIDGPFGINHQSVS